MQEEVENRTVTLAIRTAELTGSALKTAISRYLEYRKNKSAETVSVRPEGKQTVKELIGQNQGVSSFEMTGDDIRGFERLARRYGVDYAVKKDSSGEKPRYLVFFKARDADALTAAFTEYVNTEDKKKEKSYFHRTERNTDRVIAGKDMVRIRNRENEIER